MGSFNTVLAANKNGKEFKAYVARPRGVAKAPGLILMHEVYGVSDSIVKLADRFAAQGFFVVAPNMYWETDPDASFVYETPKDMEHIKNGTLPLERKAMLDAHRDVARDLMFKFVRRAEQGFADLDAKTGEILHSIETAASWLRRQPECDGKVAASGFCFGARNTYLALAKKASVDAGVAFYPTPLLSEVMSETEAASIDKPLLFVVGGEDPYIDEKPLMVGASGTTLAYVAGLDEPFVKHDKTGNPNISTLYYANSTHGFNRSDSKYTDEGTSDHALGLAASFLKAALGQGTATLPKQAFTTTPASPTYHPVHKV